jgi:hypothetical protein
VSVESKDRTWRDDELVDAIRDHFRLQVIGVGHVAPRGEVHVSDHAVMGHAGAPSVFNRATALSVEQPDVALGEVNAFFGGLPHSLWIDADAVTADVDALLRARGYVPLPSQHGVARASLPDADEDTDGLHPELVTNPADASAIADVAASGYGAGVNDRLIIEDLARGILRHARPWDHGAVYAVREAGRIVSIGSLLCTKDVAGIWGLATLPSRRDRHAAAAIAARALADGAALGNRVAVSVTSPDSESMFRRLGFRTVTDLRVYRQATR